MRQAIGLIIHLLYGLRIPQEPNSQPTGEIITKQKGNY